MNDLNTLMHASVDDVCPDVDRLLAVSVRVGTRMRRRRMLRHAGAGVGVAAVATIAAVSVAAGGGTTARQVGPASVPRVTDGSTAASLQAGEMLRLGDGVIGMVVPCPPGKPDPISGNPACVLPSNYRQVSVSTIPGAGTGFAVVLTGPDKAVAKLWSQGFQSPLLDGYDGLTYAVPADSPLVQSVYQGQAVTIHVAGWTQVGEVADDKQSLSGPGGAVADMVWRPASDYSNWVTGEKSDPSVWTSPLHDGVFVTIQGGLHTSNADIKALGASLTWN